MAIHTRATGKAKQPTMNTTSKGNRSSMAGNRINIKLPMRADRDANNRMDNS